MKTTRYFEEQVLRKRPYIRKEWCARILERPLQRSVQAEGAFDFGAGCRNSAVVFFEW
jgi:hypothetical protein